ncbi:MAG: GTP cyclohydrolase I [Bacteroidales bacterium]|nr:GTP cyclohydrolase I [Candidatus Colicola faecequi]
MKEQNYTTKGQAEQAIRNLLHYIGEDPDREGLRGTPDRILRMFEEIFRGYDPKQAPKITTFQNGADGIVYDEMVFDKGDFYSLCEHHARTFFGEYYFAYIPNPKGRILGISKIGRVVDYCSAKLQIQERLVHDIVDMLTIALGEENPPLGMALVMKGRHMCKESRGARKKGIMVSSYLTGIFKTDSALRNEFLQMIEKS